MPTGLVYYLGLNSKIPLTHASGLTPIRHANSIIYEAIWSFG